jgi:hypothetical protein
MNPKDPGAVLRDALKQMSTSRLIPIVSSDIIYWNPATKIGRVNATVLSKAIGNLVPSKFYIRSTDTDQMELFERTDTIPLLWKFKWVPKKNTTVDLYDWTIEVEFDR